MSWLYSQALVEEYSADTFLDGAPCALWNGTHTQRASWLPAKMTDACRLSRSGMTFKPLTDDHGEAVLTSFLEAFPARTYQPQEREPALTESEAECGHTWRELSVKFDPDSSSWKTAQCLWDEDLPESSVTLPRWGMMRHGELWERTMPEHLTSGTESGSWPTPLAHAGSNRRQKPTPAQTSGKAGMQLSVAVRLWPAPQAHKTTQSGEIVNADGTPWDGLSKPHSKATGRPITTALADAVKFATPQARDFRTGQQSRWENPERTRNLNDQIGGQLNPTWVEWLMGWPLGWTDCAASAMAKFRQWCRSHGKS